MERLPPLVRKGLCCISLALQAGSIHPSSTRADTFSPSGSAANPLSFRIVWDGGVIPEVTKISGLGRHKEVVLEHEGWERDLEVVEPSEPSFNTP